MREYVLMTDSCCDLTDEMAKQFDLTVLPLSVIQDGTEYVDYLDKRELDPAVFYDRLRKGSLGSTSAANVSAFHGAMEPILEQGKDILCISFSSALSTTYQSAVIAGQELEEAYPGSKILVIDSKCASLGQGMPERRPRASPWRRWRTLSAGPSLTCATGSLWTTCIT